jgi:hypothetical protein
VTEQTSRAQGTQLPNPLLNQELWREIGVYQKDPFLEGVRGECVKRLTETANPLAEALLETVSLNARRFGLKLVYDIDHEVERVLAGKDIPSGTMVSLGLGNLHIRDKAQGNRLGDGVRYRDSVDFQPFLAERAILQIHPSRRGILNGGLTINLFLSRQVCQLQNVEVRWTRPNMDHPEAWVLYGITRKDLSAGEELSHDINDVTGYGSEICLFGPYAEALALQNPLSTSRCTCSRDDQNKVPDEDRSDCPRGGVYVTGPIRAEERAVALRTAERVNQQNMNDTGEQRAANEATRGEGRRMIEAEERKTSNPPGDRSADSRTEEPDGRDSGNETTSPRAQRICARAMANRRYVRIGEPSKFSFSRGTGREPGGFSPGTQRPSRGTSGGQRTEASNASSSGASLGSGGMGGLQFFEEDPGPDSETAGGRMSKKPQVWMDAPVATAASRFERRQVGANHDGKGRWNHGGCGISSQGSLKQSNVDRRSLTDIPARGDALHTGGSIEAKIPWNVERLRNVWPGPSQSEAAAASQQGDSPRFRAGDDDAGCFSKLHSGSSGSNSVQTQGLRFPRASSRKNVFSSSDEGSGKLEGNSKEIDSSTDQVTSSKDATPREPVTSSGKGRGAHSNRNSAALSGGRSQASSSMRHAQGPRHSFQPSVSGKRSFLDSQAEAGSAEKRIVSKDSKRAKTSAVYSDTHREITRAEWEQSLTTVHKRSEPSSQMPSLSPPLREQPRCFTRIVEAAGHGGGSEIPQANRGRQLPVLRNIDAERRYIDSDSRKGAGADPFSAKRTRERGRSPDLHGPARSLTLFRNGPSHEIVNPVVFPAEQTIDTLRAALAIFLRSPGLQRERRGGRGGPGADFVTEALRRAILQIGAQGLATQGKKRQGKSMNKQSGGTWGKDGFNRNRVNALGLDNRGLALYNRNNNSEFPHVEA